jgi:hypothetical protein
MASFGWDQGQIYSTSVLPGEEQVNSHSEITGLFLEFIQNFRVSNNYIYRYIYTYLMIREFSKKKKKLKRYALQRPAIAKLVNKATFYRSRREPSH